MLVRTICRTVSSRNVCPVPCVAVAQVPVHGTSAAVAARASAADPWDRAEAFAVAVPYAARTSGADAVTAAIRRKPLFNLVNPPIS